MIRTFLIGYGILVVTLILLKLIMYKRGLTVISNKYRKPVRWWSCRVLLSVPLNFECFYNGAVFHYFLSKMRRCGFNFHGERIE